MVASRHLDPAPGTQVFLSEDEHGHQRSNRRDVEPMDLIEQCLVVHQADDEHRPHTCHHPIDLPNVGSSKLRVLGGAVDLHHTHAAEDEHEDQQHPVEIAV